MRRLVIAPIVVVLGIVALVATPLAFLIFLALIALVPRHIRALRVVWLAFVYLVWDAAVLVALFLLWIASGFGWKLRAPAFRRAHYGLAGLALRVLFWVFGSSLRLKIETAQADAREEAYASVASVFSTGIPLIVASRHAGPGDSFILIHVLLNAAHRMPRIVLAQKLQWDAAIDAMLSRIPSRFIAPAGFGPGKTGGGSAVEAEIGDLARGMAADDALVIFPEGGNFTTRRRRSRIDRLRGAGREEMAERAEALTHVMAPHPGGVHAALCASDSDVVFVAHTGLERLVTLGDIWQALPMDKRITMRAWRVPRAEVPEGLDAQAAWLFDWFARIDRWIEAHSDPEPGNPHTTG
ncbi:1-acyl-sn-glycerol-3-phosphate acyltransferase [Microbacterium pumilum]|uniref:1-acyl-sn-glycerol-3-phosphate acyltransferase n=1 Tax=Microbacterium pumilum TaxID=344165 RepID=UPI0031D9D833